MIFKHTQILMIASLILVKTMEPVETWSTTTNVIVFQDSMKQTVKTVSTLNAKVFVSGNKCNIDVSTIITYCLSLGIDKHFVHFSL